MAAPRFSPAAPIDTSRGYHSPDVAPGAWSPDRRADLVGPQPTGDRFGFQGPDQGYALKLAELVRPSVIVQPGETVDDAMIGIVATALARASLFGRAPVIHDLRVAQTLWGFDTAEPPAALVAERRERFDALAFDHGDERVRELVDTVPVATLRQPAAAAAPLSR
ncbi:MAG: hypothetical protein ACK5OX_05305 [Desertimonas sp.]